MNILHLFSYNEYGNGGFSQRINRQIELFYKLNGITFRAVHFVNITSYFNMSFWKKLNAHKKRYVKNNYVSLNTFFGFNVKMFFFYPNLYFILLAAITAVYIKIFKINVIYAENVKAGYIAYIVNKIIKIPYVLDLHGVVAEEYLEFSNQRRINLSHYDYLKYIEATSAKHASKVICVSQFFKKYLMKTYNIKNQKLYVVPCNINVDHIDFNINIREKIRQEQKIEGKNVFIYNGSFTSYQCIEEMVEFFKKIRLVNKNSFFIFLITSNHNKVLALFKKKEIPLESFVIKSVPHKEVKNYQMASDYGIIIRNDSLVNKVASPTKLFEYLSTGLKIVGTNNIGDINEIPTEKFLFDYDSLFDKDSIFENVIDKFYVTNRYANFSKAREFLENNFLWDNYLELYHQIFSGVANKSVKSQQREGKWSTGE